MSLVAYDDSSESEYEESEETAKVTTIVDGDDTTATQAKPNAVPNNGHISDEDDYVEHSEEEFKASSFSLSLPKPRKERTIQEIIGSLVQPFAALPTPKVINQSNIEEEIEDEFLHKKDNFVSTETKPTFSVPTKGPVRISVPLLKEFRDVQMEMMDKTKAIPNLHGKSTSNCSGLLSILPKAKSELSFSKNAGKAGEEVADVKAKTTPSLIPDTVKYRRPAYSTEGINDDYKITKKIIPQKVKSSTISSGGVSDDEDNVAKVGSDFFSLEVNDHDSLPDVSANEISMMVAKKAAKIAQATNNYLKDTEIKAAVEIEAEQSNQQELDMARKRYHDSQLDTEATRALVGSSAKRRRNQNEQISVVDLNSDQILPNREEWMRTALASSTTYQPTGVLVDEEPVAGTRRKHQITYLAHKAKANEAELQAIWAANRQTRRATQSKYGF